MLAAIIVAAAILLDQITKIIAVTNLEHLGDSASFIPGFMRFQRYHNDGGAWSMFGGGGWKWFFLIAISTLAIGAIVFILVKYYKRHTLLTVSLAMVLGGAVGNMIDRFRLGYVIDFLHTEFIKFPTFNIADCFITVGTILLAVYIIFYETKAEQKAKAQKAVLEEAAPAEAEDTSKETTENE